MIYQGGSLNKSSLLLGREAGTEVGLVKAFGGTSDCHVPPIETSDLLLLFSALAAEQPVPTPQLNFTDHIAHF